MKSLKFGRFWAVLGAVAIVMMVTVVVWYFFNQTTNPPAKPPSPPSVAKQPLIPTNLERTRRRFGPWVLSAPHSTGAPRMVMLLENGGVDVSAHTIRVGSNWKQETPFQIVAVVAGRHSVRLRTNDGHIYKLRYRQAFILAQEPGAIFAFRHNGPGKALLVSTSVDAVRVGSKRK